MSAPLARVVQLATVLASLPLGLGAAQVVHLATMTAPDLARLDRARTAVILPGGILEEHGPYLPIVQVTAVAERDR